MGGDEGAKHYFGLSLIALGVLVIQIALGGWLAANYAAPHCSGLPFCNYAQPFSLSSVFQLPLEHSSYEFGVLSQQARMSIHLLHRIWALCYLCRFGTRLCGKYTARLTLKRLKIVS